MKYEFHSIVSTIDVFIVIRISNIREYVVNSSAIFIENYIIHVLP